MLRSNRLLSLALVGALGLGLTACGGDEEPTTPTSAASPTTQAPAEPTTDDAAETTEAAAPATTEDDAEETTEAAEETTDGTAAGDVPVLEEIWPTVLDNTQNADSLDVTMGGVMEGEELAINMRGHLDDSNYLAKVAMQGAEVEVVMAEGFHYVRGDEGFWTQAGVPDASGLAGTWVEIPEEMGFADAFSMSTLWRDFFSSVPTSASDLQTSDAELTELDGQEAYHYTISTEDAEIWVAAEDDPYLLKVVLDEGSEEPMTIEITDFNDVDEVPAPEDSKPIEEVMGGTGG